MYCQDVFYPLLWTIICSVCLIRRVVEKDVVNGMVWGWLLGSWLVITVLTCIRDERLEQEAKRDEEQEADTYGDHDSEDVELP